MKHFLIVLISLLCMSGCVVPPEQPPKEQKIEIVSFDGNEQNGGIIDFLPGKGWVITQKAAQKYLFLVSKFGDMFVPKLESPAGLTSYGDNYLLTQEGMVSFARMNQKWKETR